MRENCLISVVIPTHNRADLLPRAIHSVLGQTYKNLECIVVDDASTDKTEEVVREFDDNRLIYLRHKTSLHASATRNTGIATARGEFIAFLDDDDEWLYQKLEKQLALITSLSERVGMVYCWLDSYEGDRMVSQRHPQLRGNIFKHTLDRQPIGNSSTLLIRRTVINKIGGFDESLPRGNDGDLIRRVCRDYEVDFVPEVLVKVYVGHGHERITSRINHDGILAAIKSQEIKLEKFKDDLKQYPKQESTILARTSFFYAHLGNWEKVSQGFIKSFRRSLTAPDSYRYALRTLMILIFRRNAKSL